MRAELTFDPARIELLRSAALDGSINLDEYYYHFWNNFPTSFCRKTFEQRYADALYEAFDRAEIEIGEGELIVGRSSNRALSPEEAAEYQMLRRYSAASESSPFGQDSHMVVDYELLLARGIDGIKSDIDERIAALGESADDIRKAEYYAACKRSLDAVVNFSRRYAEKARELAKTAEPKRAAELSQIAENCENVPLNPPRSFWEALQSVETLTFCLGVKPMKITSCQYQLGRPDRYLLPFYERDVASGKLTEGGARLLCDCMAIMINRRVPHGLSSGYMLGGRKPDGSVVSNALTRLFITAVSDNRLVYPSVGLCTCPETPEEDLQLACETLAKGCSHPAFFNDDVIRAGLQGYGLSPAESCRYTHSTCVEITPEASSDVWVASPYHNLAQLLLDTLSDDYPSMDALLDGYFARISEAIRKARREQVKYRWERRLSCDPLLSCFVHDCLERGIDIERGGARRNWIMPSFVGLSNAADALNVIRTLIFERGELTFDRLRELLRDNFEGEEAMRLHMLSGVEKYGNDDDRADEYPALISSFIAKECRKYDDPDPQNTEGKLIPSLFCWIMHDILGRETGATPDGRKAGFPLGDGSGPAQGREHKGPTSSILSSTKWEHKPFIGGIAVNLKFSKSYMTGGSLEVMKSLVKTYLKRGGFELQINVTDAETLLRAQKEPEQYRDLVVRIGGYSDYFVTLSPTMQSEVIMRTTHEI